ncbi:hypothetical protein BSKO_07537 [Bryopsis sp. KO-2023]|nr:hypothetical protein BSKO_07537 [Bryopsis sp. KO-2023]
MDLATRMQTISTPVFTQVRSPVTSARCVPLASVRSTRLHAVAPRSGHLSVGFSKQDLYVARPSVVVRAEEEPAAEAAEEASEKKAPAKKMSIEEIVLNEIYPGTVVSKTNFGAFVNIGAENDCLVHISQLSEAFVNDVGEVVYVGMPVQVKIVSKDVERGRVGGSFKHPGMNLRPPTTSWE